MYVEMTVYKCLYARVSSRRLHAGFISGQQTTPHVLKLVLRRTRTVLGAREVALSSAVVWNSLPQNSEFRHLLLREYPNKGYVLHGKKKKNVCQTLKSLLVFVPELVHPMTSCIALYKCAHQGSSLSSSTSSLLSSLSLFFTEC